LTSGSELACQAGTYDCAHGEGVYWVIVCDGQNWHWQSACDPYQLCIVEKSSARCYTPPKPTVPPQLLDEARGEPATTSSPSVQSLCEPGTYTCGFDIHTGSSQMLVCPADGSHWLVSAECGATQHCIMGPPGVAHCIANRVRAARGEVAAPPTPEKVC
jgi:hypothetical protein